MLALVTGAGMRVFRAVQSVISATQGIRWNRQLAMAQLAYEWDEGNEIVYRLGRLGS